MYELTDEKLEALGLPIMQARVYVAALQSGQASIQTLARKSGVNRSTIYTFIDELKTRGFLYETRQGKRRVYKAANPEHVVSEQRMRMETLENFLPELQAMNNASLIKPKVTYYEGLQGIKDVYQDMLDEHCDILAYEDLEHLEKGLPKAFFDWFPAQRARHGVHISSISRDTSIARTFSREKDKDCLRTTKFIEEKDFKTDINIYGNKIALMDLRGDLPFCVLIENQHLAETMRMLWKQLWNRL